MTSPPDNRITIRSRACRWQSGIVAARNAVFVRNDRLPSSSWGVSTRPSWPRRLVGMATPCDTTPGWAMSDCWSRLLRSRFRAGMLALGLWAGASHASVILDVQSGRLMGASNVIVDSRPYTVDFTDVACGGFYPACSNDLFVFRTLEQARAASAALLGQVFLDGPLGAFDTDVWLTNGCSSVNGCIVSTPFLFQENGQVISVQAINAPPLSTVLVDMVGTGTSGTFVSQSLAPQGAGTFAKWGAMNDPGGVIPLPTTVSLMFGALIAAALGRHRT
jgi:hypothetical protein